MKLAKKIRKQLYEAAGQPIAITWPEDAPNPRWGHRYQVYTEKGAMAFSVRVEGSKRVKHGTRATVRIDDDPTRILPGLKAEPERVSVEYEALLAQEGAQKTAIQGARLRREYQAATKKTRAGEQTNRRSAKAVERHQRAIERRLAA